MAEPYSRRSFVVGVLTCGSITASATYLVSRPQPAPGPVTLRIGSGDDDSGARQLLIELWNLAHPDAQAEIVRYGTSTSDQRIELRNAARDHTVDVVNLDVIDVPAFAREGLIAPITLPNNGAYLPKTLETCRYDNQTWAVPFNSDVGVLYQRAPASEPEPRSTPQLTDFFAAGGDGSVIVQLKPANSAADEVFVVNVLELATTLDPTLLGPKGTLSALPVDEELARWRAVVDRIKAAVDAGRLVARDTEGGSSEAFLEGGAEFMRNWPTAWPELEAARREETPADRLTLRLLPKGMLGGQNLALVAGAAHPEWAMRLVRFLTSPPAQKVLAMHGFVPAHLRAYDEEFGLVRAIPHLGDLRRAVEEARLRPIHHDYREFARVVREHIYPVLWEGRQVEREFVDDLHAVLA